MDSRGKSAGRSRDHGTQSLLNDYAVLSLWIVSNPNGYICCGDRIRKTEYGVEAVLSVVGTVLADDGSKR